MPSRLRFPKPFHIRRARDFSRVYRIGKRARGSILLLVGAPNGLGHPRLGLSVSKKIWKHAVKRNRVRRVFREAFRLSTTDLPPFDFVLIPAEPRLLPNTKDTVLELTRLARKLHEKVERASAEDRTGGVTR
ncbi:Ribonuclease P protein component [Planctomycetes bacterium Poly30]|uniref:Ribonuclease P protein component n=1 Tax=Saltatorellus ferox TaxID=2528018 RepID=A0A518ES55_9BACT|nr:Ribonuclease P protein component [Planctomycetes bacterium Poly30]